METLKKKFVLPFLKMDLYGDPYRAATWGKEKERQYSTYGIKAKRFNWAM
jgi:hypothetical protein